MTAFVVVDAGLTGCIDQDFGGEFNPGGSEAQNLSAITFAAGSLGLSRDLTGGYSSALPLYRDGIAGRGLHYEAPRSTWLVAGQYVRTKAGTSTR